MKHWSLILLAAGILAGCGQPSGPVGGKPVSHWAEVLRSPDANNRRKAVRKLGNLGTEKAWPVVLSAFKDREPRVRAEAVHAVLKFGPKSIEAIEVLKDLQKSDSDNHVRSLSTQALAKLERDFSRAKK